MATTSRRATEIKKVLTDAANDEDEPLTREQVEYVLEYEEGREKPPTRKRVVDFCNALLDEFAATMATRAGAAGGGAGAAQAWPWPHSRCQG